MTNMTFRARTLIGEMIAAIRDEYASGSEGVAMAMAGATTFFAIGVALMAFSVVWIAIDLLLHRPFIALCVAGGVAVAYGLFRLIWYVAVGDLEAEDTP